MAPFARPEWKEAYFRHRQAAVFALVILVVATLSFGLGYLANREMQRAQIVIEKAPS